VPEVESQSARDNMRAKQIFQRTSLGHCAKYTRKSIILPFTSLRPIPFVFHVLRTALLFDVDVSMITAMTAQRPDRYVDDANC
jgi:hypothetical protein